MCQLLSFVIDFNLINFRVIGVVFLECCILHYYHLELYTTNQIDNKDKINSINRTRSFRVYAYFSIHFLTPVLLSLSFTPQLFFISIFSSPGTAAEIFVPMYLVRPPMTTFYVYLTGTEELSHPSAYNQSIVTEGERAIFKVTGSLKEGWNQFLMDFIKMLEKI